MAFDEESINAEYEQHIRDIGGLDYKLHWNISRIIGTPEDYNPACFDEYLDSDIDSCTEVLRK